jgi:hypothetical protein
MATNYIDQIMELEAQKQALMAKAKDESLKMAEKAIADLNNLGFNYRLVEGDTTTRIAPASTGTRTRKAGVADEVLAVIKSAPDGLPRAGVLEQMGAHDTKAQQSISNALSNLKKKGQLTADGGIYKAV